MKILFSHGQESGPWGSKIKQLAQVAEGLGFEVDSVDYQGIESPELRVEKLLGVIGHDHNVILVGSSMGGYVSMVAASKLATSKKGVKAVFLLAPALYMPGYAVQDYPLDGDLVEIVHGWSDEVIGVEHSIKFAQASKCSLHLIDGDHRLKSSITTVISLFERFLLGLDQE
jgi:pimeloyl-ACP methyl ester carboxylesterase